MGNINESERRMQGGEPVESVAGIRIFNPLGRPGEGWVSGDTISREQAGAIEDYLISERGAKILGAEEEDPMYEDSRKFFEVPGEEVSQRKTSIYYDMHTEEGGLESVVIYRLHCSEAMAKELEQTGLIVIEKEE